MIFHYSDVILKIIFSLVRLPLGDKHFKCYKEVLLLLQRIKGLGGNSSPIHEKKMLHGSRGTVTRVEGT